MTVPGRRGMDLLINDNNKYLLQTKIHNDNKKAKHSKRTEHIIFKEANPWKLKIEAYWAEKGCKTRRSGG